MINFSSKRKVRLLKIGHEILDKEIMSENEIHVLSDLIEYPLKSGQEFKNVLYINEANITLFNFNIKIAEIIFINEEITEPPLGHRVVMKLKMNRNTHQTLLNFRRASSLDVKGMLFLC